MVTSDCGQRLGRSIPRPRSNFAWNHKMLNVMDAVSNKEQVQAKGHLNAMMYAESRPEALKERKKFEQAFRHNPKAVKTVVVNWERLTMTFPASTGNTCGRPM